MNTNAPGEDTSNAYQQQPLPNLAPASSFSPAPPLNPTGLTSSFRVSSGTPQAAGTPSYQPQPAESSRYGESSPITAGQQRGMDLHAPYYAPGADANGGGATTSPSRPARPDPPYMQFTTHMRPQLENNGEHPDTIPERIQAEWDGLSADNRKLWEVRYQEQMAEYTAAMDAYKRASRREASSGVSAGPS